MLIVTVNHFNSPTPTPFQGKKALNKSSVVVLLIIILTLSLCALFSSYVPPLLWGKNGHIQTVVYAKMGRMRDPIPSGTRHTKTLQDGSTLTFDFYQPTASHPTSGM